MAKKASFAAFTTANAHAIAIWIGVIGLSWIAFEAVDHIKDTAVRIEANQKTMLDSITAISNKTTENTLVMQEVKCEVVELKENTKALTRSYVKHLSNDRNLTKDMFLEYMEGLQIELKKKELRTPLSQGGS